MIETLTPNVTPEKITPEKISPIKPSEAIRLGRLKYPNVIAGKYRSVGGACTMAAMAAGYGRSGVTLSLYRYFPDIPAYVINKISSIPLVMDNRVFLHGEKPEDVEASIIRALEALGYQHICCAKMLMVITAKRWRERMLPVYEQNAQHVMEFKPRRGVMNIMGKKGDEKITWDSDDPKQVLKARTAFEEYRKKGYKMFKMEDMAGQKKGEEITEFDPNVERIVAVGAMVGG